jgi:dipeptidyl aminopeptidase/acylaminoacyl peptidase
VTAVERARDFEAALRRAGKPVEAKYYEGGEHNGIFTDPVQHDDEVRRMAAFLRRHLATP